MYDFIQHVDVFCTFHTLNLDHPLLYYKGKSGTEDSNITDED